MQTPEEFVHLVHCFHQDMTIEASTEEGWIINALKCLSRPQQLVVRQFLNEVLAQNPSAEELQRIWSTPGPDWRLSDDDLRIFLAMIRDMIR